MSNITAAVEESCTARATFFKYTEAQVRIETAQELSAMIIHAYYDVLGKIYLNKADFLLHIQRTHRGKAARSG
jgi:hypothetical protein